MQTENFFGAFMKHHKIIAKCLFLVALFFLSFIFFFMNENSGTDAASETAREASPALAPNADHAVDDVISPVLPAVETPAALQPRKMLDASSLALLAVFHAHSPLASAVILVEGGDARRYHVGDALPEGGKLATIRPTEVVVEDSGRHITLRLALRGGAAHVEVTDANDRPESGDQQKLPQSALDLLKKLDLTPVSENAPDGYLVGDGFPKSGTEEVGVKPGDTIVTVNGYPVGEYTSDYLVWLSFKDQYRASVLVRRENGEEFMFHIPDDLKNVSAIPGG
tara:strand:- start:3686 stop:4528 length:843 start_codon:yes stop_codon:yes gene_type:complete